MPAEELSVLSLSVFVRWKVGGSEIRIYKDQSPGTMTDQTKTKRFSPKVIELFHSPTAYHHRKGFNITTVDSAEESGKRQTFSQEYYLGKFKVNKGDKTRMFCLHSYSKH